MALDPISISAQFPTLNQKIDGSPLIYLDSAATSLVPMPVMDAIRTFEETSRSNVHRGMHVLAERATTAYENARKEVSGFLNANRPEEIIFTKGCTESINLVARSFGSSLQSGDVIVLSLLEHHSNIVPWMQLKEAKGIKIKWIDIYENGYLNLEQYKQYLDEGNVKIVAITGQSNVLGVRPPIKEMIIDAHRVDVKVLIDASQLAAHHKIDVQKLDCDFLALSGHKLYGPTGIGVLYGKRHLLEEMPPFLGGGTMIHEVTKDGFTAADIPNKFEAGTPPITQAIGLGASIDWLKQFDWKDIEAQEKQLIETALQALQKIEGLTILGSAKADEISGCISFSIQDIHPHDLTEIIGREGICLRAGHHCTQPLHERLKINASTRLSFGIYNNIDDIQKMIESIERAKKKLLG